MSTREAPAPDARRPASLQLTVPATPGNVALARQVLAGLADALNIDEALSTDMKIAITEACTNVVVHAYPEADGATEITITAVPEQLVISVRDSGTGMNPFPADASTPARLGYGLALMASLSHEFGIQSGSPGTEVRMVFALNGAPQPEAGGLFEGPELGVAGPGPRGDIVLALAPGAPVAPVLGRFVSLLAARASLSIDRMSDVQMVSDALAMHAPRRAVDGVVRVGVTEGESAFEMRVGPLHPGGGDALIADATLAGVGSLLHRLGDEIGAEPADGSAPGAEVLRMRLAQTSPPR